MAKSVGEICFLTLPSSLTVCSSPFWEKFKKKKNANSCFKSHSVLVFTARLIVSFLSKSIRTNRRSMKQEDSFLSTLCVSVVIKLAPVLNYYVSMVIRLHPVLSYSTLYKTVIFFSSPGGLHFTSNILQTPTPIQYHPFTDKQRGPESKKASPASLVT